MVKYGIGSFDDVAHALGHLIAETARLSGDALRFLRQVGGFATESLLGNYGEREVIESRCEPIERAGK